MEEEENWRNRKKMKTLGKTSITRYFFKNQMVSKKKRKCRT